MRLATLREGGCAILGRLGIGWRSPRGRQGGVLRSAACSGTLRWEKRTRVPPDGSKRPDLRRRIRSALSSNAWCRPRTRLAAMRVETGVCTCVGDGGEQGGTRGGLGGGLSRAGWHSKCGPERHGHPDIWKERVLWARSEPCVLSTDAKALQRRSECPCKLSLVRTYTLFLPPVSSPFPAPSRIFPVTTRDTSLTIRARDPGCASVELSP